MVLNNTIQVDIIIKVKVFLILKKILQTLGQDNEAIKELERKRIGGVPPIIKVERNNESKYTRHNVSC